MIRKPLREYRFSLRARATSWYVGLLAMALIVFSVGIYGFALLAMLVPAVSDFDIALGRTSAIQG